jgi:hypothetical protein
MLGFILNVQLITCCFVSVPDFTVDDLLRLKATLVDLEEEIDKIDVPYNSKGITKPGM